MSTSETTDPSPDAGGPPPLRRTPVDPWPWSLRFGYHQAELVEGARRQLFCAGQTSVDGEGNPCHHDDMRAQIVLALDNLEQVLASAGMDLSHVVRLGIFTTDVDAAMQHLDVLGTRFGPFDNAPPMTLLGVDRLALPPLRFEIEATAVA